MRFQILPGLVLFLSASTALAAQQPDLKVTINPPAVTPHVYQDDPGLPLDARYDVKVQNIGNKNAAGVTLTIQLPKTGTSPQVYIMGTLGAKDSRCNLAGASGTANGTKLVCLLNTITRNGGFTVPYFSIKLPEKTGDLVITASATTTTLPADPNPANNTNITETADLIYYNVAATGTVNINHCTGTALTAYFECTKFPSSISSHSHIFNAGGTISFSPANGYTGRWRQPALDLDHLEFEYYLLAPNCQETSGDCSGQTPEAEFIGRGTNNPTANCFEGLTRFPDGLGGYSSYVAPYEVCP